MVFTKTLITLAAMITLLVSFTLARPVDSDANALDLSSIDLTHVNFTERKPSLLLLYLILNTDSNTVAGQAAVPLVCNELILPANEILDCARELQARGDEILHITKPRITMKLCERPHVYISGRSHGLEQSKTKAHLAGNAVEIIHNWCGQRGGSWSANGDQGDASFVVHVYDQWVPIS